GWKKRRVEPLLLECHPSPCRSMGHHRLGSLPNTRPWNRVVGLIADGESAAVVAAATTSAAVVGLERARSDAGIGHVVFLLAHTVLASRSDDFPAHLARLGIFVPEEEPGLYDLTAGFTRAVRLWHGNHRIRQSDLGEIAELAAVESLTRCVGDRCGGIFPCGLEVPTASRSFSTRNGFSVLAHDFFARFLQPFLRYPLGRELPLHVGSNGRFADPPAQTAFVDDLEIHSRDAALIVKKYAGEWYSKARFEQGITENQAQRFA